MKSKIFYSNVYKKIEYNIIELMNQQEDFLSEISASSPRAAGDAIQSILAENFEKILGDSCGKYNASFARRAMADIAFSDKENLYYVVDVKTHRIDTHFNMPNLTSVERLTRFYEDDNNYFVILNVAYIIEGTKVNVKEVNFIPIEFLSWDCLTIGALGWGQIQIANSNNIKINPQYSRKKWMLELCSVMLDFYPKELLKINKRIKHFESVKKIWESKED
ncbi:MAG: hypothetical protein K6T54_11650 [Ignavibacterium sp.]|nr:hypothetical protein [Ignavibacterium sp.]